MTPKATRFHPPDFPTTLIGLTLALSTAAYFRFFRLAELMVFATDQGRAMLAGRNILLGKMVVDGPLTSVGSFSLGPFYYYLTAIALWFSNFQPIGPAIMTASFGVATAILLFLFIQKYWGSQIAIVSSLFFAFSPLAAAQSRIAIEPSPLPFFTFIWLWLTVEWIQKKQARWFFGAIATTFLSAQLNFSAIIFLPIMAFVWLVQTPRLVPARKTLAFTTSVFFLFLLELYKSSTGAITDPAYLSRMWSELTAPANLSLAVLLFAVFLLGIWRIQKQAKAKEPAALVLFATFIFALFAFLLKHVSGDHALAILFPVLPVIIALGLEPFFESASTFALVVLSGLFLLLCIQSNTYITTPGGQTLLNHQKVVQRIIELADGKPYNLIYRGHLDVYDAADDHYQYLLWLAGHPPADSARIELKDEYRERWLLNRGVGEKTIILNFPAP